MTTINKSDKCLKHDLPKRRMPYSVTDYICYKCEEEKPQLDKLMVEHVAEAISPWRAGKDMRKVMMVDWQSLREEVKQAYRDQAIAAIEAYKSYSSKQ